MTQEQLDRAEFLFRPMLDRPQVTSGGVVRRNPIAMVMVGGGEETYGVLERAVKVGIRRRWRVVARGVPIGNLHVL